MISQNIPIDRLDEHVIKQFLGGHLLRCDCPKPVVLVLGDLRAGCNHLLEMFRDQGGIAAPVAPIDPISEELRRYRQTLPAISQ